MMIFIGKYEIFCMDNDGIESKEATTTVVIVAIDAPRIIVGNNGKWTKGSKVGLIFKSNAKYKDFDLTTAAKSKPPATGDNWMLYLWLAIICLSAGGVYGTGVIIRRRRM